MRTLTLFCFLGFATGAIAGGIDREALIRRNSPVITDTSLQAPLSVGNGGFCFTADITGLQTFSAESYAAGMPLETLARWAWVTDENPQGYRLEDTFTSMKEADGRLQSYPTLADSPAGQWLRRNPRDQPLGRVALIWRKSDGSPFVPLDVEHPRQTLDLWRGRIISLFELGGVPVKVTTACDPQSDAMACEIESALVNAGALAIEVAFPQGHVVGVKNTPDLEWGMSEQHETTQLSANLLGRRVGGFQYRVTCDQVLLRTDRPHVYRVEASAGHLRATIRFDRETGKAEPRPMREILDAAEQHWRQFWEKSAALDLSGSTDPRAAELERRVVLSQYLTAIQSAGDVPPQESGLTCSTWYGKHHTEMIWWHAAHFALWGHPELLRRNLDWFVAHLEVARTLAVSRELEGARWAKMVGPEGRESPGGNPLIIWNQPHPVYLAELLYRLDPSSETLARYGVLVDETAAAMASMTHWDPASEGFALGPPLWISQEIHDPASSRNPTFELAYWRWALGVANQWRVRRGLESRKDWADIEARLCPLPQDRGRYVALGSHPDTWSERASRHDHPSMLMPLGFLPPTPAVDAAVMSNTLDAVLAEWDWETKIWGWDYPMVAMTAVRLGRPADAVEILLRQGPNNRYLANGHCPQRSDRAGVGPQQNPEIAAYLPANGSLLAAIALMVAGWDGSTQPYPGFPKDGRWHVKAKGWQRLP